MKKHRRNTGKLTNALEEIRNILLLPYEGMEYCGMYWMDNCDKLHFAFGEGQREVWKRKVNAMCVRLTGYWWTDGGEKVLTTKTIKGGQGRHVYVREDFRENTVDLDVQVNVKTNWRKNRVKNHWLAVTLTEEQYKVLEPHLGPREEPCKIIKHKRTGKKQ